MYQICGHLGITIHEFIRLPVTEQAYYMVAQSEMNRQQNQRYGT